MHINVIVYIKVDNCKSAASAIVFQVKVGGQKSEIKRNAFLQLLLANLFFRPTLMLWVVNAKLALLVCHKEAVTIS